MKKKQNVPPPKALLSPQKAAEYTGIAEGTFRNWRSNEDPKAPPYYKDRITGKIGYLKEDLDKLIAERFERFDPAA